jgi:hypothetical protein
MMVQASGLDYRDLHLAIYNAQLKQSNLLSYSENKRSTKFFLLNLYNAMGKTIETIFPSSKNYTNDLIKIFSFQNI